MSVNVEGDVRDMGEEIDWVLRQDDEHHLASITAELARENGQAIWRDPLVGHPVYGDDPTHAVVEGRKKGARANTFAKHAVVRIVRAPSLKPEHRQRWEAERERHAGEAGDAAP